MGMHQPGWREKNEERAWEAWSDAAEELVAQIQAAATRVEHAVEDRDAAGIMEALRDADEAGEALFKIRHGPENPDH